MATEKPTAGAQGYAQADFDDERLTQEAIEALSRAKGEPKWMLERRLEAWSEYQSTPAPDTGAELWRRTNLALFPFNGLADAAAYWGAYDPLPDRPFGIGGRLGRTVEERGAVLVRGAGQGVYRQVHPKLRDQGVIFTDLDTAVREHRDLLQEYLFNPNTPAETRKLDLLHIAFWTSGTLVYVPPGVSARLPLRTLTLGASRGTAPAAAHTLIVADESSAVTVVEDHLSADASAPWVSLPVTEIVVRKGASVRLAAVQEHGRNARAVSFTRARVQRDARVTTFSMSLGGRVTKTVVECRLEEPGGESLTYGLALGAGRQRFEQYTLQEHLAPNTTSNLLYKVALKDRAESAYLGLIRMGKAAQQSNAFQTNRNLLLSGAPRADSTPVLEIEADDVKCSHAAAVGPLEEEQIYYLQCRGIDAARAERMLVEAFFAEVTDRLQTRWLSKRLKQTVNDKMGADAGGS